MPGEDRGKIEIRPQGRLISKTANINKQEIGEMKQDIKRLKKHIGRLVNIAEHEEQTLEEYKNKTITITLIDGSAEKGTLKEITKFQIITEDDNQQKQYYYKSAIIKYAF